MWHPKRVHSLAAFALLAIAIAAQPAAAGDSRWYLNGQFGQSSYRASVEGRWGFDGDDESATAELGVTVNPYLAIEAGYHDLGEFAGIGSPCPRDAEVCTAVVVPVEADVSGVSLAAVPRWAVSPRLSLYGKLGVIDWSSDIRITKPFREHEIDSLSGEDLLAALGARWELRDGLGVGLEYRELGFDLESASVGLSYRF